MNPGDPSCYYAGGTDPTHQSYNLRGVYACVIRPTFAGADRYLSIQLGGIDVSRVDIVPPLNVTKITQGPFPVVITPGELSPAASEVENLPLYFQANV